MPDIFVPGVKSRFDTEKIISGLMEVERVPRNRVVGDNEKLEVEKTNWQELGRRITAVRENSRSMFSHQNPFKESAAISSDPSILDATSTREAEGQSHSFLVKQTAKADKLMSNPLDKAFNIASGNYVFSTGKNIVSLNFRGGTVKDFITALNHVGDGKIKADAVAIKAGTTSLVIESLETGEENKLNFSGAAMDMAVLTGILGQGKHEPKLIAIKAIDSKNINSSMGAGPTVVQTDVQGDVLMVSAMSKSDVPMNGGISPTPTMILKIETSVLKRAEAVNKDTMVSSTNEEGKDDGTTEDGNVEENLQNDAAYPFIDRSIAPRVDNLSVLSLVLSDGTTVDLPPVKETGDFSQSQYNLATLTGGKTAEYLRIDNNNTHSEISLRNIHIFDPMSLTGADPLHPVTEAQDAIIAMDGIEVKRPTNNIDDLIPGVTLNAKNASDKPVDVTVATDTEGVKNSVIEFVGNYNRLMADLNVLTRNDESIIRELTYLSKEEADEMRAKLGMFAGDNTLTRFRGALQQIATSNYVTTDGNAYSLSDFGISTDARRGGGYDPSKLRGYLEIDEKIFDAAAQAKLRQMSEVFGRDTDGDLIIDAGAAYEMDKAVRPYVELGGIISTRVGSIDSRISANKKRIDTMDKQLAVKEQSLKNQYGQMEGAYNRLEKLGNSLEQFGQQNKQ